jgi:hypothetical protein
MDYPRMALGLEKRLSPRRNTMIEAQAVFDSGRVRVPCIIRNLSETGAKIEVRAGVSAVPQTFDLVAPGHRPHNCRVVWRALKEMGVEFTG